MKVKPTSVQAYREHIRSGAALTQQDRVFQHIEQHPGFTRMEISHRMGIQINSLSARVKALLDTKMIAEGKARPCRHSGRMAAPLYIAEPPKTRPPLTEQERLPI